MQNRAVALLFDLDNTLIRSLSSITEPDYFGGIEIWLLHVETLRTALAQKQVQLHVGLATLRQAPGDEVSDKVLAELKGTLDQRLIYFTNQQSKVKHALKPTQELLKIADRKDVILLDDNTVNYGEANEHQFTGLLFPTIAANTPLDQQRKIIVAAFEPIFKQFNVMDARPIKSVIAQAHVQNKSVVPLGLDDEPPSDAKVAYGAKHAAIETGLGKFSFLNNGAPDKLPTATTTATAPATTTAPAANLLLKLT